MRPNGGTALLGLGFLLLSNAPVAAEEIAGAPTIANDQANAGPEQPPAFAPVFNHGVWMRVGTFAHAPDHPARVDEVSQSAAVQFMFNGRVTPNVGWQADLRAAYGDGSEATEARVIDLVAKLESNQHAINLWIGRMLVPSDRMNLAGPWFVTTWLDAGQFGGPSSAAVSPHQGQTGRNDGGTLWGQTPRGTLKYYVGAYGLYEAGTSPLWNARVVCSLLNPEPGYYSDAIYFGEDRIALAGSVQYRKNGSLAPAPSDGSAPARDDYFEVSSDLLFEKRIAASVLDLEGAVYRYWGNYEPFRWNAFAVASYLVGRAVGPGRFQPVIRLQEGGPRQDAGGTAFAVDAQVNYVVGRNAFKISAGYQHARQSGIDANTVFAGVQFVQ